MELFSDRERRGLIVLLPLLGLFLSGVWLARPKGNEEEAARLDRYWERPVDSVREAELFPFDPNTVTHDELLRLGLTRTQATSLLSYRARGKRFYIPEAVADCYAIDDSLFERLRPYIRIDLERLGGSYEYAGREGRGSRDSQRNERQLREPEPFRIDTAGSAYLRSITGLTERQVEVILRARTWKRLRSHADFAALFVVDSALAARLEPYIIYPEPAADTAAIRFPVEINRADSASLVAVDGIGPKSAAAIIAYRRQLGGFYRIEQLAEVKSVLEGNFEVFSQQIYCDSCEIQKIDVNFAPPERLKAHPYVTAQALRRLVKRRQELKGGWSTAEELVEDRIFTSREIERLAPYLEFGTVQERPSEDQPSAQPFTE